MGLAWNPFGLPAIVSGLLMLAAATMALSIRSPEGTPQIRAEAKRSQNVRLAYFLTAEGLTVMTGLGFIYLADSIWQSYLWQALQVAAGLLVPGTQLLFFATFDSAFAPVMRHRAFQWSVVAGTILAELIWLTRPDWFIVDVCTNCWYASGANPGIGEFQGWEWNVGPAYLLFNIIAGVTAIVGILVSLSAMRRAIFSSDRQRARSMAAAFIVRDALMSTTLIFVYPRYTHGMGSRMADWFHHSGAAGVELIFVTMLVPALLGPQLMNKARKRLSIFVNILFIFSIITTIFIGLAAINRISDALNIIYAGILAFISYIILDVLNIGKIIRRKLGIKPQDNNSSLCYAIMTQDYLIAYGDTLRTRKSLDRLADGLGLKLGQAHQIRNKVAMEWKAAGIDRTKAIRR